MSVDDNHRKRNERRIPKVNLEGEWRVLIVDDNFDNLAIAEAALMAQGIEVELATDGLEGLKVLETFSPTVILLDLAMPNMDGWAMFDKLKANPDYAKIPVIALTAHVMDAHRERVAEKGFTGFIAKPFLVSTLVSEIKHILETEGSQE